MAMARVSHLVRYCSLIINNSAISTRLFINLGCPGFGNTALALLPLKVENASEMTEISASDRLSDSQWSLSLSAYFLIDDDDAVVVGGGARVLIVLR